MRKSLQMQEELDCRVLQTRVKKMFMTRRFRHFPNNLDEESVFTFGFQKV